MVNKKLRSISYSKIVERWENENGMIAEWYGAKVTNILLMFLLEAITRTIRAKRTWWLTRYKNTVFFRCLLHYRVCTRVSWGSLSLMASQKFVSSMQHRKQSIIAVRSRLPINHLRQHKNDGCACMHTPVYHGTVWKWKRSHLKMTVQWNWMLTFYWPLL